MTMAILFGCSNQFMPSARVFGNVEATSMVNAIYSKIGRAYCEEISVFCYYSNLDHQSLSLLMLLKNPKYHYLGLTRKSFSLSLWKALSHFLSRKKVRIPCGYRIPLMSQTPKNLSLSLRFGVFSPWFTHTPPDQFVQFKYNHTERVANGKP